MHCNFQPTLAVILTMNVYAGNYHFSINTWRSVQTSVGSSSEHSLLLQPKRLLPHTIWYVSRLLLAFGCWLLQALSTPVNHICLPKMCRASPTASQRYYYSCITDYQKLPSAHSESYSCSKACTCVHTYIEHALAAPVIQIKPHYHLSCPGNFIRYALVPNGGYFCITSKMQEEGVNRFNQPQELQSEILKAAIEANPQEDPYRPYSTQPHLQ